MVLNKWLKTTVWQSLNVICVSVFCIPGSRRWRWSGPRWTFGQQNDWTRWRPTSLLWDQTRYLTKYDYVLLLNDKESSHQCRTVFKISRQYGNNAYAQNHSQWWKWRVQISSDRPMGFVVIFQYCSKKRKREAINFIRVLNSSHAIGFCLNLVNFTDPKRHFKQICFSYSSNCFCSHGLLFSTVETASAKISQGSEEMSTSTEKG